MEEFGRLTFPNSRTASPVIDGDLVITRGITANWGTQGPGGGPLLCLRQEDRRAGLGFQPRGAAQGQFLLASAARLVSGPAGFLRRARATAAWCASTRAPASRSGACRCSGPGSMPRCSSIRNDKVIAIYGTPYELGQMVALKHARRAAGQRRRRTGRARAQAARTLGRRISPPRPVRRSWSATRFTWSPRKATCARWTRTRGAIKWKLKLGIEQRNACPLFADGKLYVPMLDDPAGKGRAKRMPGRKGAFYIIKPRRHGGRDALPRRSWKAAVSGRPWPTTASSTCRPRATSIAGAARATIPALPQPPEEKPWPAAGPADAASGDPLGSAAASGRKGHLPRALSGRQRLHRRRTIHLPRSR